MASRASTSGRQCKRQKTHNSNEFMHPRNYYYQNPPNFRHLAQIDPSFQQYLFKGKSNHFTLDWQNPEALYALTRLLLKVDFGIKWEMPRTHLCPRIPNRLNYIHWIEDLVRLAKPSYKHDPSIIGMDIGTGASCIYPLLATKLNDWSFIATDIDPVAIESAKGNIQANKLQNRITLVQVKVEDSIAGVLAADESKRVDFTMSNPPFFDNLDEADSNPASAWTGVLSETTTSGGEVEFILRMITDSLQLRERVTWYTSMVGRKKSLKPILAALRQHGVKNTRTTEFLQGSTRRWGIAWSFTDLGMEGLRGSEKVKHIVFSKNKERNRRQSLDFKFSIDLNATTSTNTPSVIHEYIQTSIEHHLQKHPEVEFRSISLADDNTIIRYMIKALERTPATETAQVDNAIKFQGIVEVFPTDQADWYAAKIAPIPVQLGENESILEAEAEAYVVRGLLHIHSNSSEAVFATKKKGALMRRPMFSKTIEPHESVVKFVDRNTDNELPPEENSSNSFFELLKTPSSRIASRGAGRQIQTSTTKPVRINRYALRKNRVPPPSHEDKKTSTFLALTPIPPENTPTKPQKKAPPRTQSRSRPRPVTSLGFHEHNQFERESPQAQVVSDEIKTARPSEEEDPPIPINPQSRKHLEIKASMLAKRHHLDVQKLHEMRVKQQEALRKSREQRERMLYDKTITSSTLNMEKKRMRFLFDHYTTLGGNPMNSNEKEVLHHAVEDWVLQEDPSELQVARFWEAIDEYINDSYILDNLSITKNEPEGLSAAIALDCLRKLADRLPTYARVLDVAHETLSSSIFIREDSTPIEDARPRTYYVELQNKVKELQAKEAQIQLWTDFKAQSLVKQISDLFVEVVDNEEAENLILKLISSSTYRLSANFIARALEQFPTHIHEITKLNLVNTLTKDHALTILERMTHHNHDAVSQFYDDHFEYLEYILFRAKRPLGQKVLERSVQETANILMNSNSLLTNILHSSPTLLKRILDQHSFSISALLASNQNLFKSIIAQVLKENLTILLDHFVKNPGIFTDIIFEKPLLLQGAMRSSPDLLKDLIGTCQDQLHDIFLQMPQILTTLFAKSPELVSQLFRNSEKTLSAALSVCPQALTVVLQKTPRVIRDIAHRAPALVSQLLRSNPDLLIDPLEQNPVILSQILPNHPELLTDPLLEELHLLRDSKADIVLADVACQTDPMIRTQTTTVGKEKKKGGLLLGGGKRKKPQPPWSVPAIVNCAAKLLCTKIRADQLDDSAGFERDTFPDTVQDYFIQTTGLKTAANKQIGGLVSGIKKWESSNLRVKWVGVLLGIIQSEKYNESLADIYLKAIQLVLPGDDLEDKLAYNEDSRMVHSSCIPKLVDNVYDTDTPVSVFNALEKRLEGLAKAAVAHRDSVEYGSTVDISRYSHMNIDEVLNAVMEVWLEYQENLDREFYVLFEQADTNGDGVLTYEEFSTMVRTRDHTIDDRMITRMFKTCGHDNAQGEHEINPADFVTVMRLYKQRRMYRLRNYT